MVRGDTSQARTRALGGRCRGDSGGDGAKAEDRCPRCSAYSRSTAGEPVPENLDSFTGRTRCATAIAASTQDGLPANCGEKPIACAGHGPGRVPKTEVVGS